MRVKGLEKIQEKQAADKEAVSPGFTSFTQDFAHRATHALNALQGIRAEIAEKQPSEQVNLYHAHLNVAIESAELLVKHYANLGV